MNSIAKIIGVAVAIAMLGACSDDDADPAPAPVPLAQATQAEVKDIAALGLTTSALTGSRVAPGLTLLSAVLQNMANYTDGSHAIASTPCTADGLGGSVSGTVTKTGSHAGLAAGEQVTFVYDKCFFGDSDMVVDGTVQLTARSVVVPSATGGYSVSFDAVATGLTITYKGLAARYDGEVEVVSAISDPEADTISTRFAVPADRTFDIVLSAGEPTFSVSYGAGTTFASTSTESTRSASVKLDGTVAAGVAAGTGAVGSATGMVAMAIATPTALAGPPPTDLFVATSGVIVTRSIADDLSTSVTIVGDNLTVRGDTDRNGAPDLSFDTTWAGLITP